MNAEEMRDLAAVYALGGLEGEDRARFEALLQAGDPDATSAVRDFQGTLLELAAATTEAPPARVKQALMERIGAQTRVQASPSIAGRVSLRSGAPALVPACGRGHGRWHSGHRRWALASRCTKSAWKPGRGDACLRSASVSRPPGPFESRDSGRALAGLEPRRSDKAR